MQPNAIRKSSSNTAQLSSENQDSAASSVQEPALREQVVGADESEPEHYEDQDDDLSQAESDARSLEWVCTRLSDIRFDRPEQWQACFQYLAPYRHVAARAAHAPPRTKWLAALAQALARFLEDFDRHVQSGAIDLRVIGGETAAAICNGLGMLSELVDCRVYSAAAQKGLRAIASRLSPMLVDSAMKSGVAMGREATQATLALLTWLSRGLKARLLQSDDAAIRAAYRDALESMAAWMENPTAHGLDGQQLATCFVQLNTIRQFDLLPLQGKGPKAQEARERLQAMLKTLCAATPKLLTSNGVSIANICNTLKDYLEAGLLPKQTHGWLMPAVALLLQRMPQISRADLLARGGQVLANCANFLRMLFELELLEQPAFIGCVIGYRETVCAMVDLLRRSDFQLHGDTGQSLANLLSFIKAMARMEVKAREKLKPHDAQGKEAAEKRQALLNSAARRLLALAAARDAAALSPISLGGMLSALGYLWSSGMAPAETCRTLTHKLLDAIPSCEAGRWEGATIALCMRAIVESHGKGAADASSQLRAFLHLLVLLEKTRPADDGHVLYCLQALRLGVQQKWIAHDSPRLEAALRKLLNWTRQCAPGVKDLADAITGLADREEAAPAMLECVEEASAPAPQPGEVGWTPPGGKLAVLSSEPALQTSGAARSTTYRAPADTSAGAYMPMSSTSSTSSTSSSASASSSSSWPSSSSVFSTTALQAPADPATRWFELASGDGSDAATLEGMRLLAKQKPKLVEALDGAGNSALYYLIVAGKRAAMTWLIEQPGFTLGMPLEAFRDRIDRGLFTSTSWNAARSACQAFDEAARRLFGGKDENEDDDVAHGTGQPAVASAADAARVPKGSASTKRGKRKKAQAAAPKAELVPERERPQAPKPSGAPVKISDADKLNEAYAKGDVASMRRLLRTEAGKAWAREGNERGHNKLMRAAFEGNVRMIEVLLEVNDGELAEQYTPYGSSAFLVAAGAGHAEAVKILLKFGKGRLAMQKNRMDGKNALMMAAARGKLACVKLLLAWNGGKLAGRDELTSAGENALTLAAREGHADVVMALLGYREGELAEVVTKRGYSAMALAAQCGHAETVRVLLGWRQGALALFASVQGYTPLLLAAKEGHVAVLAALLESPNGDVLTKFLLPDGRNALMLAAEAGHADAVKALLAAGIDPRKCTNTGENALMLAAQNGHEQVVDALLQADGAALVRQESNSGETALTLAVYNGRVDVYTQLCQFDRTLTLQAVKPEIRDLYASMTGSQSARANTATPPKDGSKRASASSLSIAAQGDAQVAYSPSLATAGIALVTAIRANDLKTVKSLVNESSFEEMINQQDERGETPVHLAVRLGRLEIMRTLVKKIDWSFLIEDTWGTAPLQIAVENRDAAMLELILDHIPAEQMRFVLGDVEDSVIGLALQNGDAACLGILLDRLRGLDNVHFALLLREVRRPARDDAHRAALALLDIKQAVVGARQTVYRGEGVMEQFMRDEDKKALEKEFAYVRRVTRPDYEGSGN